MAISEKDQAIIDACRDTDEPIFVLRAKDMLSTGTIVGYGEQFKKYGPDNPDFLERVSDRVEEFQQWQNNNTNRVRYPD